MLLGHAERGYGPWNLACEAGEAGFAELHCGGADHDVLWS